MAIHLTEQSRAAWEVFLNNQDNHGHAKRVLSGHDIDTHVSACWLSAINTAKRIHQDLPGLKPKRILEIGCSTGLNCYALQEAYPTAEIIGIEPEHEAVHVARLMLNSGSTTQPQFYQGFGEKLPFSDASIDLIVCHTVIEHVNNVEKVIKEISRVLSQPGFAHLDAPNYRFPYEPHLGIFTIPEFGKTFVKFTALLQGQWRLRNFVDHLKFVTPKSLEQDFRKYDLVWHNRAIDKLQAAASGNADIKKYRMIGKLVNFSQHIGLAPTLISIVQKIGLYPSVLYTLRKRINV